MLPISFIIFFIFVFIIFFLSKIILNLTFRFLYQLTNNKNLSFELLSFLILPGTIIHELSHLLFAELLFVRSGELSFKPQIEENNNLRVGAIKISKTDPFRRTIIGLAPLVVGLTIIGLTYNFYISGFLQDIYMNFGQTQRSAPTNFFRFLFLFFVLCLLSSISLTMFSSRKDLKQLLIPALILLIFVLIFWLAGFRLTISQYPINFMENILINSEKSLAFIIILNLIALAVLKGLNYLVSNLFRH
jgi:hypothetical protein